MNKYISEVLIELLNTNNREELIRIIDKTEEFIKKWSNSYRRSNTIDY